MDDKIYQELKSDLKKRNSRSKYGKYLVYGIILFIILLPQILIFFMRKPYEYIEDLDNLPEPIQTEASGGAVMQVFGEDVYIDFLAKYEVSGKVISVRDYIGADAIRKLGPRDFVLGWGKMGRQEIIDKFNWNDMKDRYIYAYVPRENVDRFDAEFDADVVHGNRGECRTSYSNNHPIPANRKIRLLMKKIKEGDAIRLKGYLVYVHPEKGNRYWGPSSLVRDDTGNHACEIIYVTDVSRLKEK